MGKTECNKVIECVSKKTKQEAREKEQAAEAEVRREKERAVVSENDRIENSK